MKRFILLTYIFLCSLLSFSQWAENFNGKTTLDLTAECWDLVNVLPYAHNGTACGLLPSTSIIASEHASFFLSTDSLVLNTPQFVDSGLVFFDYTINQRTTKNIIVLKKINRAGRVVFSDTLQPDTILKTATIEIGPLESISLRFVWLSTSNLTDTIFIDEFIATVDPQPCGIFSIEEPVADKPLSPITEFKHTSEHYISMWGQLLPRKPIGELFIIRKTYAYKDFYDQRYYKQVVIR